MRTILLSLVFLPFISFSQSFDVGLNVGGVLLTSTKATYDYYTTPLKPAIYIDAHFTMRIKKYGFGLKIGNNQIVADKPSSYMWGSSDQVYFAEHATTVSLFASRYFTFKSLELYAGAAAGIITYKNHQSSFNDLHPTAGLATTAGNGHIAGIQLGCNYSISRRISLNFESGLLYTNIRAQQRINTPDYNLSFFMCPVTLGVKYKFTTRQRSTKPTATQRS